MRHRMASSSCTQGTPAGLPSGMPGIGLVIDGAMQHAPQPARQLASDDAVGLGRGRAVGAMAGLSSPLANCGQAA
jgi:hypothetical protein